MPKKRSHGGEQEYIPAGNGLASGTYASDDGNNEWHRGGKNTTSAPKSHDKTNDKTSKLLKEVLDGIKSYNPEKKIDGGFTIDNKTGKAYKLGEYDGYAVGGYGTEKIVKPEEYNNPNQLRKIIKDYIKENIEVIFEDGACLGGWIPSDDENVNKGNLFLDVSKVSTNKEEVVKWAIIKGEDTITDFKNIEWPSVEQLAKEYGLEKEYEEARKRKLLEREKRENNG